MHERSKGLPPAARRRHDRETGGGDPPRTPLGHEVVSCHPALCERIREDLRAYGRAVHSPSSAFRLQALYLDFGRLGLPEHLAESVRRALDVPRDAAGLPDLRLREAERHFFGGLDDEDVARMHQRVARLSRRALMTALAFNAHFWNMRLALEIVGGVDPLEGAALGTCALVAERRIGRSLGGDLRYLVPLRERREAFCSDRCLPAIGPHPSDDRPSPSPRTPADCGMVRILEGFRFFASFPDE